VNRHRTSTSKRDELYVQELWNRVMCYLKHSGQLDIIGADVEIPTVLVLTFGANIDCQVCPLLTCHDRGERSFQCPNGAEL